ncbi:hypothetical protein M9458_053739, partial [Cirrhinus mrigala]
EPDRWSPRERFYRWSPCFDLGFGRLVSDFQASRGTLRPRSGEPGLRLRGGRRRGGGGGRTEAARAGLLLGRQKLGSGDDFQWIAAMSCSATHDTPTQNQVVYESFSTGFSTKLRCLLGVGSGARSSAPRSSHVRLSAPEAPGGVPAIPGRSKGSALR